MYFVTKWDSVLLAGIFCSPNKETTHKNVPKGDVLKKSHCNTIRLQSLPEVMTLWKEKKNRLTGIRKQARCMFQKSVLLTFYFSVNACEFLLVIKQLLRCFLSLYSKVTLLPSNFCAGDPGLETWQHPQTCLWWIFRASHRHLETQRIKPWRLSLKGKRLTACLLVCLCLAASLTGPVRPETKNCLKDKCEKSQH